MKNIIFDGENYYLFRALNDGNKKDLENGINIIRTDCVRYYEEHGEWGKYSDRSEMSLEEVYDHIKMRYRRDTNCISLTSDANVVLTYHNENPKYVLVKVTPDQMKEIFDAGEYFSKAIEQQVLDAEKNVQANSEIAVILNQIENATSTNEIKNILNKFNPNLSTYTVNDRQYLSDDEQIKIARINAKLKILENSGLIGNIIENVPNAQLLATMGNAYTSCEYIHYGDIPREITIDCPKVFIETFSLLQQARENGVPNSEIDRINGKVLELIQAGYDINERNNTFSNKENMIYVNEQNLQFLMQDYSSKQELRKDLSIDKAFELTGGRIGYNETNMQLMAIRSLSEMLLKKKALVEILKKALPEEKNIETILDNTYCINPELVIKQNGRGHQLSNTVNLLISEYGYDLSQEDTRVLLENVSSLNIEQLLEIYNKGIDTKGIERLLVQTKDKEQRIQFQKGKDNNTKYIVEAIIEGYDWRKTRKLTKDEKNKLAQRIVASDKTGSQIKELYNAIERMVVGEDKFTQDEIFAIIMNIAIDKKIGNTTYTELLRKNDEEKSKILWDNVDSLQTSVISVSLDLLMERGKTIEKLKQDMIRLGISRDLIGQKDVKNIFMANKIISEYNFETELSNDDKKYLIISLLKPTFLNKDSTVYLSTLINKLKKNGMLDQDIYSTIINLSVEGSIKGQAYTNLLHNNEANVIQLLNSIDRSDIKIDNLTLIKAKEKNLTIEDEKSLISELTNIGLKKEFLEQINPRNIFVANEIVSRYNFEGNITEKEKMVLIKSVLNNSNLNRTYYLSTLMQNLKNIGLSEQEIFGSIINLSINNRSTATRGFSYTRLLDTGNKIEELKKSKKEIETKVKRSTIDKALVDNIEEYEIEELVQFYRGLGIEEETILEKDTENLYMIKKIVEEYSQKENITDEESKAILQTMINNKSLNKGESGKILRLIQGFERIGLSGDEICGTIINLGIKGYVTPIIGYDYNRLLSSSKKILELEKYKSVIETKVDRNALEKICFNSHAGTINEMDLISEYENLGIEREFIDSKDTQNLLMAKKIVDEYEFERKLSSREEKAILRLMLRDASLNKGNKGHISTLVKNLKEIGLDTQEAYGVIINSSINANTKSSKNIGYSSLLHNRNNVLELAQYKDNIEKNVDELSLDIAVMNDLEDNEKKEIVKKYEKMGIAPEFIQKKDIRNLYIANKIVNEYKFEEELEPKDKKAILECILNNSYLDTQQGNQLTFLIKNLYKIGQKKQEVYGTIINSAVNGTAIKRKGYSYSKLISSEKITSKLQEYKNEIETKVSKMTIRAASLNTLSKEEVLALIKSLQELNIPQEIIDNKNIKNLYIAKDIVDSYQFNGNISDEEKCILICSILSSSKLNKGKSSLISLVQEIERTGLKDQEIYGIILNLAINGSITTQKGYGYAELIQKPEKFQELIKQNVEIKTNVTEENIEVARNKAKRIMKKTVKQIKEQGSIGDIPSTMNELENMATMEFTKDNPSNTNDMPNDGEQEL